MARDPGARRPAKIPQVGEPAPFFTAATDGIERYSLDVTAGRWIVLMFFGALSAEASRTALETALKRRALFDGLDAAFWGVSVDRADRERRGLASAGPGVRYFWDFDLAVSRLFALVE